MATERQEPVLRRLVEAGRGLQGPGVPLPAVAVGQAFAKAAQEMMKLPVVIADTRETRMTLAEIPETLPDRALLAMLDGPGEGLGLAVLSPGLLSGIIEMQTTGKIGAAEVAARRPTRTDAAMSARFIDRLLEELEVMLANDSAIGWAGGFRYSSYLDDPRPLGLLMEDIGYRALRLRVLLGAAERQADLALILPAEGRGPLPKRMAGQEGAPGAGRDGLSQAEWRERIAAAVMGSAARLHAVLDRISLPLSKVVDLKVGMELPLSPDAIAQVRVEGAGGLFVTSGKLGQCQGHLAVRLMLPVMEEVAEMVGEVVGETGPAGWPDQGPAALSGDTASGAQVPAITTGSPAP